VVNYQKKASKRSQMDLRPEQFDHARYFLSLHYFLSKLMPNLKAKREGRSVLDNSSMGLRYLK